MNGPLDHQLVQALRRTRTITQRGRIVQAFGTLLRASGVHARIGQQCRVLDPHAAGDGAAAILAEVVGFSDGHALLVPLSSLQGMALDAEVEVVSASSELPFGDALRGRVIDCFGRPLDGLGPVRRGEHRRNGEQSCGEESGQASEPVLPDPGGQRD